MPNSKESGFRVHTTRFTHYRLSAFLLPPIGNLDPVDARFCAAEGVLPLFLRIDGPVVCPPDEMDSPPVTRCLFTWLKWLVRQSLPVFFWWWGGGGTIAFLYLFLFRSLSPPPGPSFLEYQKKLVIGARALGSFPLGLNREYLF